MADIWAIDVNKGGNAIPYHMEDSAIRGEFEAELAREGVTTRMNPAWYERAPTEGEDLPPNM